MAAAVVSVSFIIAGCDLDGGYSGSTTYPLISSIEETTGGIETLTEYTYDDDYLTRAEKRTVGGKVVHEDTGYERDEEGAFTITYYRKFYAEDGTTVDRTHKRVSSYDAYRGQYKFEAFDMTDETVPVEYWEVFFDKQGNVDSYIRKLNGVVVEERTNYQLLSTSESYTVEYPVDAPGVTKTMTALFTSSKKDYLSRIEIKEGDRLVEYTQYEYSGYVANAYETYKVDGSNETLIEKKDNYETKEMTATYDITRYDENGDPVKTEYEETYFNATFRVEY